MMFHDVRKLLMLDWPLSSIPIHSRRGLARRALGRLAKLSHLSLAQNALRDLRLVARLLQARASAQQKRQVQSAHGETNKDMGNTYGGFHKWGLPQ
jgi:hypothetical protein